ncbi:ABC transporter substrate-binding protein [Paraburkholderia caffeinilytica]|uniref:ABC transporter substrate-binding protein n=1 Tax=Paraburkholderia caffeinilytica TaxID=1761016 RepID=UPI0038B74C27
MKTTCVKLAGLSMALSLSASANATDLKVGLITSLSGPGASQGIPYAKGVQAGVVFKAEVAGHKIQVIQLDDGSDPSTAARDARKLIDEDKVDVLIGTAGVPGSMAIAAVARDGKTPLVSVTPLTLAGEDSAWAVTTAQPAPLMISGVVDAMKRAGVRTVGYIGFSDSWGDLAYDTLVKLAGPAGMKVVSNERYARNDTSVAGQVLRVMSSNPDAVLTGTAGTAGALPYLALAERGYRGGIYGTHGLINPDFVRVGGNALQGLVATTGPAIMVDQLPDSNSSKKTILAFRTAYQHANHAASTDAFSAYAFDAWLVVTNAAAHLPATDEPGTAAYRAALRDAIFSTRELAVTQGVLNFKPGSPYGADQRALVIVKLDKGQWKLVP